MNEYVPSGMVITPIYYRQHLQHAPLFFLTRVWAIGVVLIILVLIFTYFSFFICVWSRFRVYSMISQAERKQRFKSHTRTMATTLSSSEESPHSSSLSSTSELSLIETRAHTTPYSPQSQESETDSVDSGNNDSDNSSTDSKSMGTSAREQMMEEYEFRYGLSANPNKSTPHAPQPNELYASSVNGHYGNNSFAVQGANGMSSRSYVPFNPLTTNPTMYYSSANGSYIPLDTTTQQNTSNVLQPRHILVHNNTSPRSLDHQRNNSFVVLDGLDDDNYVEKNDNLV